MMEIEPDDGANAEAWDEAMGALTSGHLIVAVSYGEANEGQGFALELYLEGGGMVELTALPCRAPEQPFERGARMIAELWPRVVYEEPA